MFYFKPMKILMAAIVFQSSLNCALANESNDEALAELPEPLSYQDAINFAQKKLHYSFLSTDSAINIAELNVLSQQSDNDLSVNLKGYLRKVGVSDLGDPENDNDSKVSLIAKKKLYDFGLSSSKESLNNAKIKSKILEAQLNQENYLNKVIEAYFNVLRADNEYLANNENMSIAFIRFNRSQEHQEFGLTSDVDILKAQTNYELVRQQRYLSEVKQRYTRQLLSELLGSSSIPDQLETPKIDVERRIIEDVDLIITMVLENSTEMSFKRAKLFESKQLAHVASNTSSALIEAELEVSDYQRESSMRDDWRASINFNFPLYSGNQKEYGVKLAIEQQYLAQAQLKQSESSLRIKVLDLWQQIKQKTVELDGAFIKQEYRDLYLEKSRTDYELEYKTDLGDAMVQFSKSRAQRYQIEYDLEIAWQKLIQLVGQEHKNKLFKVAEEG